MGYSDTTVHLHEEIVAMRKGRIEAIWPDRGARPLALGARYSDAGAVHLTLSPLDAA